ncbi:MAG TPA: HEAT repeat domain-containing protein, partial [Gemmataceae bacterium]|nr:HEAT repeat domain-containing protein [Gemmataceae bacterium]
DRDAEIAQRASQCVAKIEASRHRNLPLMVVQELLRRRPAGTAEALLHYLPYTHDPEAEEAIWYGLYDLAGRDPQVLSLLVTGLRDGAPARRAVAACIVGRRGTPGQQAEVRKLLADSDAVVRLRAAQGLLAGRDKTAVPVLVALLEEPSTEVSWQAEELLHWVAGEASPKPTIGAGGAEARRLCHAAWQTWWDATGVKLDLSAPDLRLRRPKLWVRGGTKGSKWVRGEMEGVGFLEVYGCDGTVRWHVEDEDMAPGLVRWLPGNHFLVAEPSLRTNRVTERDLQGRVVWDEVSGSPSGCQRLPNGNTFVARGGRVRVVQPDGTVVGKLDLNESKLQRIPGYAFKSWLGELLPNGHVLAGWCNKLPDDWSIVELDLATKTVAKRIPATGLSWGAVEALPNGHYLVTAAPSTPHGLLPGETQEQATRRQQEAQEKTAIFELDASGKAVWKHAFPGARRAHPAPDGNIGVRYGGSLLEIDRAGQVVWEDLMPGTSYVLPLLRLGFDWPLDPGDLRPLTRCFRGLKFKDQAIRLRMLGGLRQLGPKAAAAIPTLLETLGDPNEKVRGEAQGLLDTLLRPQDLPALLRAAQDKRPHVREAALSLCCKFQVHPKEIVPVLLEALHDKDPLVRRQAAETLRRFGSAKEVVVPALVEALKDKDRRTSPNTSSVAEIAANSLEYLGADAKAAVPALLKMVRADEPELRGSAVRAAGGIAAQDKEVAATVLPVILRLLKDKERPVNRVLALETLRQMGPMAKRAIPELRNALKAKDVADEALARQIRSEVLNTLEQLGPAAESAGPDLIVLLADPTRDPAERLRAANALGSLGPAAKSAVPALTKVYLDREASPLLRVAAGQAREKIKN